MAETMTATESKLNMNMTTSKGMSPVMEAVLNRYVIENYKHKRKYTQFGQKVRIPKGETKTVAFDKMSPLPMATKPISEGVTPRGSKVNLSRFKAEPQQYGNYITYTDVLDFFAHDPSPKILNYTDLLKENQLGTFEHMDAMALAGGLNVEYAGAAKKRSELTSTITMADIKRAVTHLKNNKAEGADGRSFIAFVHPNVALDLSNDEDWRKPHEYKDTEEIYNGEIGKYFGVKFIEDPDQYVFRGTAFGADEQYDELNIIEVDQTNKRLYIAETIESGDVSGFASKKVWINGKSYTIASATAGENGEAYLTLSGTIDWTQTLIERDMVIYPGDGGVNGKPVYGTVIIGKNAYGTSGDETVEFINKPLGSAGTADPLNQRGTMGWKGYRIFKIIEQTKMVRVESLASID